MPQIKISKGKENPLRDLGHPLGFLCKRIWKEIRKIGKIISSLLGGGQ
jgi:hypothetical protein